MSLPRVLTAIVTPFDSNTRIAIDELIELIRYQIMNQCGVVLFGTTGECPTLDKSEREEILITVKNIFESQLNDKFVVGVGGNNTQECCHLIEQARTMGYKNFMLTTPYYNKPSQLGLEKHFTTIMKKYSDCRFILYNVPGRCGVNLLPNTVLNICNKNDNVYAIKEASGDVNQFIQIRNLVPNLLLYCGDDGLIVPSMSIGAYGVISIASNAYPNIMVSIVNKCTRKEYESAFEKYLIIHDLIKLMFVETSPSPIKFLLTELGLIKTYDVRLPLVEIQSHKLKEQITNQYRIIKAKELVMLTKNE
jgi:4-hydroxy-tetrahydrodipicolinate synthase